MISAGHGEITATRASRATCRRSCTHSRSGRRAGAGVSLGAGRSWRLHELVAEHGLGPHLRFGCGVAATGFDERCAAWDLTLDDGRTLEATAVVCAVGQLGRPAIPDIADREEFTGPWWHSARWNHDTDLAGRRVALVGTGASAIQFVPQIAKVAGNVDVYQRSSPYVLPKADRPYRGIEQALFDRLPVAGEAPGSNGSARVAVRRWRVLTAALAASCPACCSCRARTPGLLPAIPGGEMLAVSPTLAEP